MGEEDEAFVRQFIESRRWQYAKTMPKTPHTYTIRTWSGDTDSFDRFGALIWKFGVTERFYSRVGVYLHVDGEKFWTMGEPIGPECQVINRSDASLYYGKQSPAEKPFQDLGRWA